MSMRFLLISGAVVGLATAAVTGCSLKVGSTGSGGSTGTGMSTTSQSTGTGMTSGTGGTGPWTAAADVASSTTSAGTGVTCTKTSGTSGCNRCVTAYDCGVPATNTSLKGEFCSDNTVTGSLGLWADLYNCACDGKCAGKCSKTCDGTGTDAGDCMTCLASALSGTCFQEYNACKNDK